MRLRTTAALAASAAVAASLLVAAPTATAAEAPRPIVSGWFGWWASDASIAQMTATSDGVVGEIAMFWWSFQGKDNPLCLYDNGNYDNDDDYGDCLTATKTPWTTPKFDRQRKELQAAGIKVNASITDLGSASTGKLSAYLSKKKNRRAYAKLVADYAVKAGVDGVDLDWEVFAFYDGRDSWAATKPRWVQTVKLLSKELHAQGLTLWATVPGGTVAYSSDGSPNDGTGYWVYAWSDIAPYVDRLNIMAYDYSWSVPGPIGPNNWAALVARSATEQVGPEYAERVWIGTPQYGRDWPLAAGSGWKVDADCPADWTPQTAPSRSSVTPMSARDLAARSSVEPTWDANAGEWTFEYWQRTPGKVDKKKKACDVKRRVWFADTRSALARAKIVPDLQIGGIAVWDFGTVTADFYERLAEYGSKIAPAPTTVTVKAPKARTYGKTIPIQVTADSTQGVASGAEAILYFEPLGAPDTRAKVSSIVLDSEGSGTFRVPAEASGTWTVTVGGSWARSPGESEPTQTLVRHAVTLEASRSTAPAGTPITLSGGVTPARSGLSTTLQRRVSKGVWRDVVSMTTDTQGGFTTVLTRKVVGESRYRVIAQASGGLEEGTSPTIVITVS
jgi:spore germination protein YaaH